MAMKNKLFQMVRRYTIYLLYCTVLVFLIVRPSYGDYEWNEVKSKWLSPLQDRHSRYILATGGALTLVLATNKGGLVYPLQEEVSGKKPLGQWSKFGDIMGQTVPNVIYMSSMYLHHKSTSNENSLMRAKVMFDTTAFTGLTTLVLKGVFGERRPNKSNHYSFPSGHTSTATAFATIVALEHEWYWGVSAGALATLVGYSRINDNAHYIHDVVFGATLGLAYGVAFKKLYQTDSNFGMVPFFSDKGDILLSFNYFF